MSRGVGAVGAPAAPEITPGTLLGGRVVYRQPRQGFRTGIEPVLLAASVPARPGDRVVEAGCGAGAGLLCLLARVPGLIGCAVERDAALAALARGNLDANGWADAVVAAADILQWASEAPYQHAFANPPWHLGGTESPDPSRSAAKHARSGLLHDWAARMARGLVRRGTLSFIVPAAAMAAAMAALVAANCGEVTIIPLWPRTGKPAKLMILRGVREGNGGAVLHPGLLLHDTQQQFTAAAEAVLREGAALAQVGGTGFWCGGMS